MGTNGIVLSSSVRTNLLSLQDTTSQQGIVQNRLATGKKVISALDNPTNFFTSAGLSQRSNDLAALLDGISNGVKTLEAASNGATSITKVVETMQANVRQARQDKTFKGELLAIDATTIGSTTIKDLSLSGGSVGTVPVTVRLNAEHTLTGSGGFADAGPPANSAGAGAGAFTITSTGLNGGTAVTVTAVPTDTAATLAAKINTQLAAASGGPAGFTAEVVSGQIKIKSANNSSFAMGGTLTGTGLSGSSSEIAGTPKTVDQLVTSINSNTALSGKVRASNDGGKLRIENLSVRDLSVGGVGSVTGQIDGSAGTKTVGLNEIRRNLVAQFNDLRDQLDRIAGDASYNGVNLLRGDKLKVVFNERATSSIDIEAKNETGLSGVSTAANSLNIPPVTVDEYSSDDLLDARFNTLKDAMARLQSQSSQLGANLGVVQIRQSFTKQMITTLQTGSDFLVNADMNEEGANLLALNTRQQLSQTALSLASQADQAVLRLFG